LANFLKLTDGLFLDVGAESLVDFRKLSGVVALGIGGK
jgi:hypothetical protein